MSGPCVIPSFPLPSQCLNAVRTVQSLACLEEADHTVGFILQLSSFMKEWHFHLPQLLRDVQVRLRHVFLQDSGEMLGDGVMDTIWGTSREFCLESTGFGFILLSLELNVSLPSIRQPHRLKAWALLVRPWFTSFRNRSEAGT